MRAMILKRACCATILAASLAFSLWLRVRSAAETGLPQPCAAVYTPISAYVTPAGCGGQSYYLPAEGWWSCWIDGRATAR